MRIKLFVIALGVLVLASPAPVFAQQLFDFNGQAELPALVGGTLNMYSVVFDAAPATTPLPLDFANFEYTLVITGLTLSIDGPTQSYLNGTIALYEDNGSAADFTNQATFTDGTAILSGAISSLSRTLLIGSIGTVAGNVDWTGGSRLNELAPPDHFNWSILSGTNTNGALPGYDDVWDGKVEPQEPVVSTERTSVGALKGRFGN
jgi:hypothetical protein